MQSSTAKKQHSKRTFHCCCKTDLKMGRWEDADAK